MYLRRKSGRRGNDGFDGMGICISMHNGWILPSYPEHRLKRGGGRD